MKIKLIINGVFSIIFIASCSKVHFVVQENNKLIKNACENGKRTYRGYYYSSAKDEKTEAYSCSCKINKTFIKLDNIVQNSLFDKANCIFEVDFNYFSKLQDYVKAKRPRQIKKIIILSERQYLDTLYYYDSINYAKDPW